MTNFNVTETQLLAYLARGSNLGLLYNIAIEQKTISTSRLMDILDAITEEQKLLVRRRLASKSTGDGENGQTKTPPQS